MNDSTCPRPCLMKLDLQSSTNKLAFLATATERALKQYLPTYDKTRKYLEKDKWVKEMLADSKMDKACELAEKYKGRDSYSEIYKAIKKVSESL